jgi:hypothetical protein
VNFLPRLASNFNPSNFCLPSSKDYIHEPLSLATSIFSYLGFSIVIFENNKEEGKKTPVIILVMI